MNGPSSSRRTQNHALGNDGNPGAPQQMVREGQVNLVACLDVREKQSRMVSRSRARVSYAVGSIIKRSHHHIKSEACPELPRSLHHLSSALYISLSSFLSSFTHDLTTHPQRQPHSSDSHAATPQPCPSPSLANLPASPTPAMSSPSSAVNSGLSPPPTA